MIVCLRAFAPARRGGRDAAPDPTGERQIIGAVELRHSPKGRAAWGRFKGCPLLDHLAADGEKYPLGHGATACRRYPVIGDLAILGRPIAGIGLGAIRPRNRPFDVGATEK